MFFGYFFTRNGMFPQAAVKGTSSVTINLALPTLLFSSIVPAFTAENVSAIGPLVLLAAVYILIGLLFGLVIREVCYVPRNFWQGIVVASGMSNWSSMRTYRFRLTETTRSDPEFCFL
jgi:auxin efflux carrier family protein